MKKIILFILGMFLYSGLVFAGVERTITGDSITLSITGDASKFGGIISETLPTGYSPTGITSQNLGIEGSASGKLTGQLFEIAFGSSINPATVVYGITGTGDGSITGSYVFDEESGGGAGLITGDSQLGSGTDCVYSNICDEEDSCGNTRDTDGTICGTDMICQSGICEPSTPDCLYSSWTPTTCPSNCTQTRTVTSGTGCTESLSRDCTGGDCPTPAEKCEFWEKKKDGECELNTGLLIVLFIGIFAFKIIGGK